MSADRRDGNYYDDQFSDRIRNIRQGSSSSSRPGSSDSGGGSKVAGGIGGLVVMAIVLGGVRSCNTSSRTNDYSYNYNPPRIQMPPPIDWNPPPPIDWQPQPPIAFQPQPFVIPPPIDPPLRPLEPLDVVYLPALCYLLDQEGRHTVDTPARRVFDCLDPDARLLLREIARNTNQQPDAVKRDEIFEALNKVLDDQNFYHAGSFSSVKLDPELRERLRKWTRRGAVKTVASARQLNRQLLDAAFPRQILPRAAQPIPEEQEREAVARAKEELAEVRRKYNDKEP